MYGVVVEFLELPARLLGFYCIPIAVLLSHISIKSSNLPLILYYYHMLYIH